MKRKITDLGENEVINCKTLEEAIEINKALNICVNINNGFISYKDSFCLGKIGFGNKDFYLQRGFTILPASDFLPQSFYQPEPKVGQLWEAIDPCVMESGSNAGKSSLIVGKKYLLHTVNEYNIQVNSEIAEAHRFTLTKQEESDDTFYDYFRFHSHPNENMKTEETTLNTQQEKVVITEKELIDAATISDRKRESFRFYDQLPEPLRTQAKENFDEGYHPAVPVTLGQAIDFGWMGRTKDGIDWEQISNDAKDGKYPLTDMVEPFKSERQFMGVNKESFFDLYSKLDYNGKAVMREMYDGVEWPKVKEYVSQFNHGAFIKRRTDSDGTAPVVFTFQNCTPEIVGNEIRFVKND